MEPVNLDRLQYYIDMGRIDPKEPITLKVMKEAGLVTNVKHGIKLLGNGAEHLTASLNIQVSRASSSAIKRIEEIGGSIETVHYNKLALRAHLYPEKFKVLPRQARPAPKLMEYYTNSAKRGYLSPLVQSRKITKEKDQK